MCGLAGYYQRDTSIGSRLQEASQRILHRGPDDTGFYFGLDGRIGLAHTRLSIQDLSHMGHQPMQSEDGAVVLVFNGEIYNFQELRAELQANGFVFKSDSDTEVLLNLYLAEGESLLSKINGIFAFAIWDQRSEALLLSRDALGVKPLYYAANNGQFFFASEIKALMPLMIDSPELDFEAVQRYLTFLWCPGAATPVGSIQKLEPGHAMIVRFGKIERSWAWYQLPVFRNPALGLTEKSAIAGTESRLRNAVHRQMVADVPVGTFLSGGLDSSSVVAFAREINPTIECFTIEATGAEEEGMADDLPYARKVAKHLNVPLHVVRIDAACMARDLQAMVAQLDEPLADLAPLNVLYISRLAREHGMKVLLSGAGGDDLFTGYRRHRALIVEKYWSWLPKTHRLGLEQATRGLDTNKPFARRLRKLFNGASLIGDERLVNYFRWVGQADLVKLYSPEFRAALGNSRAEEPMLEFLRDLPPYTDRLERMLALEQRFFLADHNLIYTDKMSMAVGVEVRVPFLDLDLVEFAAQIPAKFKQRGSTGKWVLKKAMEPHLPREVIYRPKSGFGAPLRRWMRVELRDLLADVLGETSLRNRGLFDSQAVQNLIQANDQGKVDASYTLLSLVCIELWCRYFIDRRGEPVPEFSKAIM
jgi:asparagine synthase (glutamine-hydrolysing)